MKIFIVEDDIKIRNELTVFLKNNGYDCKSSDNFKDMIQEIMKETPDLLLLDINLPDIDGYHICREIRKQSEMPIIVVTSKDTDMDELMSISFGADDFITKPYNTQILLARIQRLLSRLHQESKQVVVEGVKLNLSDASLTYKDRVVELTRNEVRILDLLMTKAGTIVSRDDLMDALWQSNVFVDDNTLTVNINRLRKKLETIGIHEFLKTKRGQGYLI